MSYWAPVDESDIEPEEPVDPKLRTDKDRERAKAQGNGRVQVRTVLVSHGPLYNVKERLTWATFFPVRFCSFTCSLGSMIDEGRNERAEEERLCV